MTSEHSDATTLQNIMQMLQNMQMLPNITASERDPAFEYHTLCIPVRKLQQKEKNTDYSL